MFEHIYLLSNLYWMILNILENINIPCLSMWQMSLSCSRVTNLWSTRLTRNDLVNLHALCIRGKKHSILGPNVPNHNGTRNCVVQQLHLSCGWDSGMLDECDNCQKQKTIDTIKASTWPQEWWPHPGGLSPLNTHSEFQIFSLSLVFWGRVDVWRHGVLVVDRCGLVLRFVAKQFLNSLGVHRRDPRFLKGCGHETRAFKAKSHCADLNITALQPSFLLAKQ